MSHHDGRAQTFAGRAAVAKIPQSKRKQQEAAFVFFRSSRVGVQQHKP